MYQLESETAGHVERGVKNHAATASRRTKTTGREAQKRLGLRFGKPFLR
jgi:hypothetical protein